MIARVLHIVININGASRIAARDRVTFQLSSSILRAARVRIFHIIRRILHFAHRRAHNVQTVPRSKENESIE